MEIHSSDVVTCHPCVVGTAVVIASSWGTIHLHALLLKDKWDGVFSFIFLLAGTVDQNGSGQKGCFAWHRHLAAFLFGERALSQMSRVHHQWPPLVWSFCLVSGPVGSDVLWQSPACHDKSCWWIYYVSCFDVGNVWGNNRAALSYNNLEHLKTKLKRRKSQFNQLECRSRLWLPNFRSVLGGGNTITCQVIPLVTMTCWF